jgi:orotate phosphoribosyltransferase
MSQKATDREVGLKIASLLLKIEAVKLSLDQPFVWASGWQSPIYCDNRKSLGYPEIRTFIKNSLIQKISKGFPDCDAIAGVATAGIPQGALIADAMELPFLYVRSKPKGHGLENLIEGHFEPGLKVVMVEDLISTGGSSLKAVEAVRKSDMEVLGLAAIFTYGFEVAAQNFERASVPWFSLSNYHLLLEYAAQQHLVNEAQLTMLKQWRNQPDSWSITGSPQHRT